MKERRRCCETKTGGAPCEELMNKGQARFVSKARTVSRTAEEEQNKKAGELIVQWPTGEVDGKNASRRLVVVAIEVRALEVEPWRSRSRRSRPRSKSGFSGCQQDQTTRWKTQGEKKRENQAKAKRGGQASTTRSRRRCGGCNPSSRSTVPPTKLGSPKATCEAGINLLSVRAACCVLLAAQVRTACAVATSNEGLLRAYCPVLRSVQCSVLSAD